MRTVTLKLPDNIDLNEKEISIMLAAKLYDLGKMSLGQAANLVGLNKEEFMNELGKYNVSVFGETLEELEQELKSGSPSILVINFILNSHSCQSQPFQCSFRL
jgi:predicted HTH domain antitoxin